MLIGTAGHVDHGKTTLIAALTGIDAGRIDRLAEEKKRGITIDLGYAFLPLPDGGVASVIDVPGHEKFIKNMLAGAGGIDLVLLVVAADDGVMPQTREHLGILQLLGASGGMVVMTKCDVADEEWRALVREDIRGLVASTFLADAPILEVSAHTGQGMDALRAQVIAAVISSQKARAPGTAFRVPVDRVFSVDGFGTVATGTVVEGTICVGDAVVIYPQGGAAKVRGLQVHGGDAAAAYAGQRAAVNLSGVHRDEVLRGDVLAAPDALQPTNMLDVRLTLLPDTARVVRTGARLHFHYGTHNTLCKAVLMGQQELAAGESCFAQLRFTEQVAVKEGDRFVVRFYSPVETVGGGTVLHVSPKKHRAGRVPATTAALEIREETSETGDPAARLRQAIADDAHQFSPLADIARRVGLTPKDADEMVAASADIFPVGTQYAIDAVGRAQLGARLVAAVGQFHRDNPLQPGIRKEALRSRLLPAVKPALFDAVLALFCEEIRIAEGRVACAAFAVAFTPAQMAMRDNLLAQLHAAPFSPPSPDELAAPHKKKAADFQAVVDALLTDGTLITTEPGILFTAQAVDEAGERLHSLPAAFTLSQFRDALATSRKFALSLLEYFDRTGITRKEGDTRMLRISAAPPA